jgi:signal transduction histidine kinase
MTTPLRLLIIDDSHDDALLMTRAIRAGGFDVAYRRVQTEAELQGALSEKSWDAIVSDYAIPGFSGLEALDLVKLKADDVPFIIVSGVIDEEKAISAMKAGARDYLRKSDLKRLAPAIARELGEAAKRRALRNRYLAFSKLGQSLSSASSPQEAARIITQVADELIGWDSCFLDLYAPSQDKFHHVFNVDLFNGERREMPPETYEALTPMLQKVATYGPQLVLRDKAEFNVDQLTPFGNKGCPSASLMTVPVRNGAELLGFLSIQSYRTNAYTQEDLETLQALADYCGGALQRIRLEKEILEISGREQHRIGQNLHDGLCQHLAGIGFLTEILADKLEERSAPEVADARNISNLVSEAVVQTRGIARGLFPVQLEENGLLSALEELVASTENVFKIHCAFECHEPVLVKNNVVAEHLYYIAHEALMNAIKHARPQHISISLSGNGSKIVLAVRDDGAGFPIPKTGGRGMGLHIINYRARMIGACVELQSSPGHGTTLTCVSPNSSALNTSNNENQYPDSR